MKTPIAVQLIQCQIALVSLAIEQREYKRDLGGRFARVKDSAVQSAQEAIAQIGEFFTKLTKGKSPDPEKVNEIFEAESQRLTKALPEDLGKKTKEASRSVAQEAKKSESINESIFSGLLDQAKGMMASLTKEGIENGVCLALAVGVYGAAVLQASGAMDEAVKVLVESKSIDVNSPVEDAFDSVSPVAFAIGVSKAFMEIKESGVIKSTVNEMITTLDKTSKKLGEDEKFVQRFQGKRAKREASSPA
jgi:ABC-type glutathione transport system ATPase component